MVKFSATIQQFAEKGEKTGWSYIVIPPDIADQLNPGVRKGYRVKGKLDQHSIAGVSLLPMGGGSFIIPINAEMRKGTGKRKGAMLNVQLQVDTKPIEMPADFLECLQDEPDAYNHFNTFSKSHQHYFIKWIESAKSVETRARRIAESVNALYKRFDYGQMIRSLKKDNFR